MTAEMEMLDPPTSFRKLATVQRIASISPIEGADAIEVARVGGWDVVVKKGEFTAGDLAIYFEIDSWIPTALAPFLTKPGHFPKTYNGVEGEKLRTIRLRGQVSQGLLLQVGTVDNAALCYGDVHFPCTEGLDVTERLGIQKWEAPISAQLAGQARGNFPSRIIKTDQERIQNLTREFNNGKLQEYTYEVQEKCEGSSCTIYLLDGEFGVCSRNLDLKETEGNTFWDLARAINAEEKLRAYSEANDGCSIAIQGEAIGPGIQDNIYKLNKHEFRLFDVQLPNDGGSYMEPIDRRIFAKQYEFTEAPLIETHFTFGTKTIADVIAMADGNSAINPSAKREGLVFKATSKKRFTFKSISNAYLLKSKD